MYLLANYLKQINSISSKITFAYVENPFDFVAFAAETIQVRVIY